MSLKKVEEVKKGGYFRLGDIVVYAVIVVIIGVLFLCAFLLSDKSESSGFKVVYNGQTVYEYDYAEGTGKTHSSQNISLLSESKEELYIKFTTDDGEGYNIIKVSKTENSVCVSEANCSTHRDCVYTKAITTNSGVISCPPHKLLILPLSNPTSDDGTIG